MDHYDLLLRQNACLKCIWYLSTRNEHESHMLYELGWGLRLSVSYVVWYMT